MANLLVSLSIMRFPRRSAGVLMLESLRTISANGLSGLIAAKATTGMVFALAIRTSAPEIA